MGLALALLIPIVVFVGGFPHIHGTEFHNALKMLIYVWGIMGVIISVAIGFKIFFFGIDYLYNIDYPEKD